MCEARVSLVVGNCREEIADRAEDAVKVILIATVVELATGVANLAALSVAIVLEDVTRLEQTLRQIISKRKIPKVLEAIYLACVSVYVLEPRAKLIVLPRVLV